jgi:hypothetical protein
MRDDPPGHLDGERRGRSDLVGHLAGGGVEVVGRDDAADDAVREGLVGAEASTGEHHVADEPVAAHLVQDRHAAGVGDDPVADLGEHELRRRGADADVAQQGPLERPADGPAVDGHDDGRLDCPDLLDAAMAAAHELVVAHVEGVVPDRRHVAPRRPRCADATPDDGPDVGPAGQFAEGGEELVVHVVVERVVLVGVVVDERGDGPVDLEMHRSGHARQSGTSPSAGVSYRNLGLVPDIGRHKSQISAAGAWRRAARDCGDAQSRSAARSWAIASIVSTRAAIDATSPPRIPPVAPRRRRACTPSTMQACFHQLNTSYQPRSDRSKPVASA